MKAMNMTRNISLVALLCASFAVPVMAQPGPGWGGGPGAGPCAANATNCGPGMMGGPGMGGPGGPGYGRGMGHGMRFSQRNTAGWSLMTQEERIAHREKMLSVKTYEECKVVQAEQHKLMEARAKEKGVTLPEPRYNGCDRMKARGFIK